MAGLKMTDHSIALITDVQRFSVHDGPGIRTTIFFKGCGLRCRWCQNPETLSFENELVFSQERCIACGDCEKACPQKAIRFDNGPVINYEQCDLCFKCAEACPARALEPAAREYSAADLVQEALKDREFYEPEGGVTLSGGEPLAHPAFLLELLPLLKKAGLHVVVETAGRVNLDPLAPVLPLVDLVLFDLKAADPELHRRLTGHDNRLILENLRRIIALKIPHQIRLPLIPGLNDAEPDLLALAQLLKSLNEPELFLLPYHRLGESKLKKLHTEQRPLGINSHNEAALKRCDQIFLAHGIKTRSHRR